MKVADALALSCKLFTDNAKLDVEVLVCHVLGKNRAWLYTWPDAKLDEIAKSRFLTLFAERQKGVPIAYLIGEREFWSLPIKVNDSTLIPRPDTELLVALALGILPRRKQSILDLGTGTGAIALALASEFDRWVIWGVDQSKEAVALAQTNAASLQLNVRFEQSDWFSSIPQSNKFDLILGNPPYIASNDRHLKEGDVRFEPLSALVSGEDGLDDIRKIVYKAKAYFNEGGWLALEHGWDQAEQVATLMSKNGYSSVSSHQDLAGNNRVTMGQIT